MTLAAIAGLAGGAEAWWTSQLETAATSCEAARANYEPALRKRPLGTVNESDGTIFMTCGLSGSTDVDPGLMRADVFLRNDTDAPIEVSCTLVDGGKRFASPAYYTRSSMVPPGATEGAIFWHEHLENVPGFYFASISCALPAGVGITYISGMYD